jgi:hypothetical protein
LEKVVRIASDGYFNVLDLRIVEKGDETKIYFQKNHKLRSVDISDFVRTRASDPSTLEPVRRELFSSPQIRQAVGKNSRNIDVLRDTIAYGTPNTVIKNVSGLISDHKGLQSRHNTTKIKLNEKRESEDVSDDHISYQQRYYRDKKEAK